jgi:hypothetical protein
VDSKRFVKEIFDLPSVDRLMDRFRTMIERQWGGNWKTNAIFRRHLTVVDDFPTDAVMRVHPFRPMIPYDGMIDL